MQSNVPRDSYKGVYSIPHATHVPANTGHVRSRHNGSYSAFDGVALRQVRKEPMQLDRNAGVYSPHNRFVPKLALPVLQRVSYIDKSDTWSNEWKPMTVYDDGIPRYTPMVNPHTGTGFTHEGW